MKRYVFWATVCFVFLVLPAVFALDAFAFHFHNPIHIPNLAGCYDNVHTCVIVSPPDMKGNAAIEYLHYCFDGRRCKPCSGFGFDVNRCKREVKKRAREKHRNLKGIVACEIRVVEGNWGINPHLGFNGVLPHVNLPSTWLPEKWPWEQTHYGCQMFPNMYGSSKYRCECFGWN